MDRTKTIAAAAAALALAAAPVAGAKPSGTHGHAGEHGQGQAKNVMYVFKGAYVDPATVDVAKGNHHVVKAGLTGIVSFDFTEAKVVVADVNADTVADLNDVVAGDKVVVKVRAPRSDPGTQPFAAKQLIDQTNAAAEETD